MRNVEKWLNLLTKKIILTKQKVTGQTFKLLKFLKPFSEGITALSLFILGFVYQILV